MNRIMHETLMLLGLLVLVLVVLALASGPTPEPVTDKAAHYLRPTMERLQGP